jgi:hypothetical protein
VRFSNWTSIAVGYKEEDDAWLGGINDISFGSSDIISVIFGVYY